MPKKKKESLVHIDMDTLSKKMLKEDKEPVIDLNSLGGLLATARQKKKKSIEEVAQTLCIKTTYIEALEQGHYYAFPARAYAMGFLRTYARYLKLDPDEMIALFNRESSDVKEEPLDMMVVEKKMPVPTKKTLFLSLVVLVLFYIVWFLIANTYSPETLVRETIPVEPQAEVVAEVETPVVENVETAVADSVVSPVPVVEETAPEVLDIVPEKVLSAPLAILATNRVWVKVVNTDTDKVLINRVFEKNEYYIPKKDLDPSDLELSTGRANALDLYVDGELIKTYKKETDIALDDY